MDEIVVYVANNDHEFKSDVNAYSVENKDKDVIKELIEFAEKDNTVYSLRDFEMALNVEDVILSNSWVYFSNKNTKDY